MKNFQYFIYGAALICVLGFQTIHKAATTFAVRVVTADEAIPVHVNDPAFLRANKIPAHYNEICWKANYANTSQNVFVSTFSTVDDANFGWPIVGTEKECHDWDQGVPLFVWRDGAGGDKEVRFLFVK